jgi:hypothetical protein
MNEMAEFKVALRKCLNMHSLHSLNDVLLSKNYSQFSNIFISVRTAFIQMYYALIIYHRFSLFAYIRYTHSPLAALFTLTMGTF